MKKPPTLYLVERSVPGLTVRQLGIAQLALLESSRRLQAGGDQVRYLRSTFIPGQSRCLCLFEAESRDLVRKVNETAQFPFSRIEEAVEPAPPVTEQRDSLTDAIRTSAGEE